ncbi:hypothetical protein [Gordonia iterans]
MPIPYEDDLADAREWLERAERSARDARDVIYSYAIKAVNAGAEKKLVAQVAGISRPTLDRVLSEPDRYRSVDTGYSHYEGR